MLGLICCLSGEFNWTEERIPEQGREMSLCSLHVLSVWSSYIPHSLGFTTYLSRFTSESYSTHWFTCPTPVFWTFIVETSLMCGWTGNPFECCSKDALALNISLIPGAIVLKNHH